MSIQRELNALKNTTKQQEERILDLEAKLEALEIKCRSQKNDEDADKKTASQQKLYMQQYSQKSNRMGFVFGDQVYVMKKEFPLGQRHYYDKAQGLCTVVGTTAQRVYVVPDGSDFVFQKSDCNVMKRER